MACADGDYQGPVVYPFPVDAHGALLDQAQCLRGGVGQSGILEQVGDGYSISLCRELPFRYVIRDRSLLEAGDERFMGLARRRGAMETPNDLLGEQYFTVPGVGTRHHVGAQFFDLGHGAKTEEFEVAPHELVGDGHDLAEHLFRLFPDANVVIQAFRHLLDATQALQDRQGDDDLGFLAKSGLELPPDQHVEFLIGAAELHVGLEGHRIVTLDQRVQEFVNGNGLFGTIAFLEIVPFQHPGHGVPGGELHDVGGAHLVHPPGIEADLGFVGVENLEDLAFIGPGVGLDSLPVQRFSGCVFARRVADHAREIPDQEQDMVAEVLKLAQLVDEYRMAQVQIGRGRIETCFDTQGTIISMTVFESGEEIGFEKDLGSPSPNHGQGSFD